MTEQLAIKNLGKNLNDFMSAIQWLNHSYDVCKKIQIKEKYSVEEFDALDALTSRYARCTDFLINKMLRSLDQIELVSGGTLIDVINRAHKRGLIDSTEQLRSMKEVRNEIAHEYMSAALNNLYSNVINSTPVLLQIAESIKKYCGKYL